MPSVSSSIWSTRPSLTRSIRSLREARGQETADQLHEIRSTRQGPAQEAVTVLPAKSEHLLCSNALEKLPLLAMSNTVSC